VLALQGAVDPALEEGARDSVAGLEAGDVLAGGDDLAGGIGEGDEWEWGAAVASVSHHEVAVVEGGGLDVDDDVARARLWGLALGEVEVVGAVDSLRVVGAGEAAQFDALHE